MGLVVRGLKTGFQATRCLGFWRLGFELNDAWSCVRLGFEFLRWLGVVAAGFWAVQSLWLWAMGFELCNDWACMSLGQAWLYEDWGYTRTGFIWGLDWGYMRIIWRLELYEDWCYISTGVISGLVLYKDWGYMRTGVDYMRSGVIWGLV